VLCRNLLSRKLSFARSTSATSRSLHAALCKNCASGSKCCEFPFFTSENHHPRVYATACYGFHELRMLVLPCRVDAIAMPNYPALSCQSVARFCCFRVDCGAPRCPQRCPLIKFAIDFHTESIACSVKCVAATNDRRCCFVQSGQRI